MIRLSSTLLFIAMTLRAIPSPAQQFHKGGEASLVLPDLNQAVFFGGLGGRSLLVIGLLVGGLGMLFGLAMYAQLKRPPVHRTMSEVSELIYETCKTYLVTQGKFLLILEASIGGVIIGYFGLLQHLEPVRVLTIVLFSLVWLTSLVSVALTFVVSALVIAEFAGDSTMWWKLAAVITCGILAGWGVSNAGLGRLMAAPWVIRSKTRRRSR